MPGRTLAADAVGDAPARTLASEWGGPTAAIRDRIIQPPRDPARRAVPRKP